MALREVIIDFERRWRERVTLEAAGEHHRPIAEDKRRARRASLGPLSRRQSVESPAFVRLPNEHGDAAAAQLLHGAASQFVDAAF